MRKTEPLLTTVTLPEGPVISMRLSSHAVLRQHERVRPALSVQRAGETLAQMMPLGTVQTDAPRWLPATDQRPALYVCLADSIAVPADPDPLDKERLVARTVLTRSAFSRPERRASRIRRRAKRNRDRARAQQRQRERGRPSSRRDEAAEPNPGTRTRIDTEYLDAHVREG